MQIFVIAQRKTSYYLMTLTSKLLQTKTIKRTNRAFSLTWPEHLCEFIGTKESVYRREEFSQLPQDWLARQQGRGFIVLNTNMAAVTSSKNGP